MGRQKKRLCGGVNEYPIFIRERKRGGGWEFECPKCRRVLEQSGGRLEDLRMPRHFVPVEQRGGERKGAGRPEGKTSVDPAKKKKMATYRLAPDVLEMLRGGMFGEMSQAEVIETAVRRYAQRYAKKTAV